MKRLAGEVLKRADPIAVTIGLILIVGAAYRVDAILGMAVAGAVLVVAGSNWRRVR